jgi:hypothetical protein
MKRMCTLSYKRMFGSSRQAHSLDDPWVVARNESGHLSDLGETQSGGYGDLTSRASWRQGSMLQ